MPNNGTRLEVSIMVLWGTEKKSKIHSPDGGWEIKGEESQTGIEDKNMYLLSAKTFTFTTSFDLYKTL